MPTTFRRRTAAEPPSTSRYRDEPDAGPEDDDDADERPRSRARGERPSRGRSRDEEPEEEPRSRRRSRDDDEPDEEPRGRSRSRSRDDDEDEPPARGRSRARDDDEPDEDEPRSRRSRRDEPEEEEPRGRRTTRAAARSRDKDSGKTSRRRGRDDDEPDERPRRQAQGGWEGYKKQKEASYKDDDFKIEVGDPEVLIKIMDDEPFATYRQHWVEGLTSTKRRSFNCYETDDCPICKTGDDPKPHALFNVVVMEGETPTLKVWDCGSGIVQILEKKAAAKTGPLSKEYYAVSKDKSGASGKGPVQWDVEVVRERDLRKEWDTEPLTDDELDEFEKDLFDGSYVKYPSLSELRKIAREMNGDDED